MLDPRRLLVLDAVIREGSMTAAAGALSYTPSAVSQAVAALEREAGAPLLERGPRGVRPTAAGALLARHAGALRERLDLAGEELDALLHVRAGRLRLAAFPSAGSVLVPPAVAAFRAAYPDVELSFEDAEPDAAAAGLRAGRYDLAIVFDYGFEPPADRAGLTTHALGEDEMLVALPPGHPAAGHDPVPVERLAAETWISSADPTCNRALSYAAGRGGFEPKVAFASDDYGAVGRLVIAGVGVALVPALAAAAAGDRVVLRRLEPRPARTVSVALPEQPSPAAAAMLEILTSASDRSTWSAPAPATP
jgi:DNA-binding transcriptional LysR family regulator